MQDRPASGLIKSVFNVLPAIVLACCSGPATHINPPTPNPIKNSRLDIFSLGGTSTLDPIEVVRGSLERQLRNVSLVPDSGFKIGEFFQGLRVENLGEQGLSLSNGPGVSDAMVTFDASGLSVGIVSLYAPYMGEIRLGGIRAFILGGPIEQEALIGPYLVRNNGSDLYYRDAAGQVLIVSLLKKTVYHVDLLSPKCVTTTHENLCWKTYPARLRIASFFGR